MAIRITGMNCGLDTEAMVQELVHAYDAKTKKYKGEQKKLNWKEDAWKELNTKIKNFTSKSVNNLRFSNAYMKKTTSVSNSAIASVVSSDNAVNGKQTLRVTGLAQAAYLTGGALKTTENGKVTNSTKLSELGYNKEGGSITINRANGEPVKFDISGDMTVGKFVSIASESGINISFDENQGRIYASAKDTGLKNDFSFAGDNDALKALGLIPDTVAGGTAKRIAAADATIELNGVNYTSSSNTFSINGLTITAKGKTEGTSSVELTTETDYNQVYDTIKNFIKEYSSLVKQMDTLYNAASADDYKMLTDEEKEAMSDDEVKEWEDKIKSALLRRDDTIGNITSTIRSVMLNTYTIDGKKYSLSSFGINTLSYFEAGENEKNVYHIAGDPDDAETSGEPDKLKAAIASNPNAVMGFFQKLSDDMYKKLGKLSSSNDYRSYGNFYEDKKLKKEKDDWTKKISDYESYVSKMEDRYYKQFTAMEKAMGNMQQQQSYISSILGS